MVVGLQKQINLPDFNSGNYLRTGQVTMLYEKDNFTGLMKCKVELLLFKDLDSYKAGADQMNYRTVAYITYTLADLINGDLWNQLFTRVVAQNEYLSDAILVDGDIVEIETARYLAIEAMKLKPVEVISEITTE